MGISAEEAKVSAAQAFKGIPEESAIGSPLKKHRASIHGDTAQVPRTSSFPMPMGDVLAKAEAAEAARKTVHDSPGLHAQPHVKDEEEEEL